jgi:hypothetical protein
MIRNVDGRGRTTIWVTGDQLSAGNPALAVVDKKWARVLMIESLGWARERPYHKSKLVLIYAAMRGYGRRRVWRPRRRRNRPYLRRRGLDGGLRKARRNPSPQLRRAGVARRERAAELRCPIQPGLDEIMHRFQFSGRSLAIWSNQLSW